MNRKQRRAAESSHRPAGGASPHAALVVRPFAEAVAHLQAGRFEDAEAAYRRVLGIDPKHALSLHHLGLVAHKLGRSDEAIALITQSLQIAPEDPDAFSNLAAILNDVKRFDVALIAARQSIALRPKHVMSLCTLARTLRNTQNLPEAALAYADALELEPANLLIHTNLADVLGALDRLDEAVTVAQGALSLDPQSAEAHAVMAQLVHRQGRNAEALGWYERALAINPGLVRLHDEMGILLRLEGRFEEAMAAHQRCLKHKPDNAQAHCNLGIVLQRLGRWPEALGAYQKSIELAPDLAQPYANMGMLLGLMGHAEAAIAAGRHAIELSPKFGAAHYNLGLTLTGARRYEDAIHAFRQAIACNPELAQARFELTGVRRHAGDWRGLAAEEAACLAAVREKKIVVSPFPVLATDIAPEDQLVHARLWAGALAVAGSKVFRSYSLTGADDPNRRIRIGYLSSDFHRHATTALISEMIERHDRTRFEVIAYCFSPNDGSDMRTRIRAAFDQVVDIHKLNPADAARRIHDDRIEILVDLKGYTKDSRMEILAYRPAPIQVNYLGYPGSMGAPFIDYIIGDPVVTPMEHQAHYDEKIVQLPDCYQPNDSQRKIAAGTPSRVSCGLPEKGFVFCAFNNAYKINEAVFAIWMRLLRAVPGSALWLLESNPVCKANFQREAATHGVDPARLVFAGKLPMEEHLARQRLADLFLDALPYNAHTTASDALWAGLPVITCAGRTFAGRVAGSLLNAVGLPELVTHTQADYEALALRLAQSPADLAAVRDKLARNRTSAPLFDAGRYTRNIEAAYLNMARLRAAGRPPEAFAVADLVTDAPIATPATEGPPMLAPALAPTPEKPDAPTGRIAYKACPLCGSADLAYHIEADMTRHALYKPALPKTMKWRSCQSCEHIFTEGYFTPEMCDVIFSDTHAVQRVGYDLEGQRKVSARIVERLATRANGGDWLDIGFGNGSLLFTAQEWGYTPVGVDLRKDNVEAMRKLQIEAYCQLFEELDFPGRFSVISMADVLEHMPYPKVALAAAHKMLRPGGYLFASMPNMDSIVWRALDAAGTNPYWGEIEHYHNFTRKRLAALLEQHGLQPVEYNISERYRSCMEMIAVKR